MINVTQCILKLKVTVLIILRKYNYPSVTAQLSSIKSDVTGLKTLEKSEIRLEI
jgi:hypothetical protein